MDSSDRGVWKAYAGERERAAESSTAIVRKDGRMDKPSIEQKHANAKITGLAKGREVEAHHDWIAFGRIDLDGGRAGGKGIGGELEVERGTGKSTCAIVGAEEIRVT